MRSASCTPDSERVECSLGDCTGPHHSIIPYFCTLLVFRYFQVFIRPRKIFLVTVQPNFFKRILCMVSGRPGCFHCSPEKYWPGPQWFLVASRARYWGIQGSSTTTRHHFGFLSGPGGKLFFFLFARDFNQSQRPQIIFLTHCTGAETKLWKFLQYIPAYRLDLAIG